MTTATDAQPTSRGPRRWLVAVVAFGTLPALLLSASLVLGLALSDDDQVSTQGAEATVDLGRPLNWLHQDQRAMDPPVPTRLGANSPWESPTTVSGIPLLLDWLTIFAMVAVLGLIVCGVLIGLLRRMPPIHRD